MSAYCCIKLDLFINTWQDYKTNEDILSELKINPAVQKIQQ